MTEEKEIKEWIDERRKGSDLMSKLLLKNEELEKENEELKKENERLQKVILEQNILNIDLMAENERLKKEAVLVWHKVTCFDKPDEDGFITYDNPGDVGKEFLVRDKFGDYSVRELIEIDTYGIYFDDIEWEDVDAWAELPRV